jgi:hypothetical protein
VGVSFPASPSLNDLYYRTDFDFLCKYDGTRWITAHEYGMPIVGELLSPVSASPSEIGTLPLRGDYSIYLTRLTLSCYVNTTNNGANYWSIALFNTSGVTHTTLTTSASAANTWTRLEANLGGAITTAVGVEAIATKVGAPGSMYLSATLFYRLVIP